MMREDIREQLGDEWAAAFEAYLAKTAQPVTFYRPMPVAPGDCIEHVKAWERYTHPMLAVQLDDFAEKTAKRAAARRIQNARDRERWAKIRAEANVAYAANARILEDK